MNYIVKWYNITTETIVSPFIYSDIKLFMKFKAALLFILSLFFIQNKVLAQAPTTSGGEYNYLYRLDKEQVRWMIDSPWVSHNNWILTQLVDSSKLPKSYTSLISKGRKKGYYLQAKFTELTVNTHLLIDAPFFSTVQETNGEWWFILRDTMQNIVKNGKLTLIKSKEKYKDTVFTYDSSCLCYPVPKLVKDHWFLFEADDAFYYMYMQSPYKKEKRKWWKFWKKRKIVSRNQSRRRTVYRPKRGRRIINWVGSMGGVFKTKTTLMSLNPGYMVVNQPKFKPEDTLKMKAFIVNHKGKPLRKKLLLELQTNDNGKQKIFFTKKVKPLTRGAYTYQFMIPDSFDLDKNYTLRLRQNKYRRKKIRQGNRWIKTKEKVVVGKIYKSINFRVEEYELQKIKYTWEDKKSEYYRGKQIWLYAKAVDANNLPVPDAKVRLILSITGINNTYDSLIKLADTVLKKYFDTALACSPDGLTPIKLPGHLIPNADVDIHGSMNFTNADNKTSTVYHGFKILANSRRYYVVEDSNGLRAGYLVQGSDSVGKKARWKVYYSANGTVYKVKNITLPYYHNWEHGATQYQLMDTNGRVVQTYRAPNTPPKQPHININKIHDSLYINFKNPLGLEIAYRIYNDKKLLTKGAATQINYAIKLGGTKPVRVLYTYSWAGGIYTKEAVGWVKEKQLNVKIDQPKTVFPGQVVAVDITVTDYKNRPVKKTNLTAYSLNMEMGGISPPQMPYYGKSYGSKLRVKLLNYPRKWWGNEYFTIKKMDNKMFHRLRLYRFPYYRLMYAPKAIGIEYDSLTEGKTQISLFAMDREPKKGIKKTKGMYAMWLDDTMVYYHLQGYLRNAFRVTPGKHKIKVRAAYSIVEFEVDIKKGLRNLIGINTDSVYLNKAITTTQFAYWGLSKEEKEAYNPNNTNTLFIAGDKGSQSKYRFNNYVRLQNSYIRQNNTTYKASIFSRKYYIKPHSYYAIAPLQEGQVEIVLPNDDTTISFYFNPAYMYLFDGKKISPHKASYNNVVIAGLTNGFRFGDTVVEIPPYAKIIKERNEKKKPKVNKIRVYTPKTLFDNPMVKSYNHPRLRYGNKINKVRVEAIKRYAPNKMWFFNNDSLEFSSINFMTRRSRIEYAVVPGSYNILLATDTNSYKIIRNFKVDTGFRYYFKPSLSGYIAYDSVELLPFIEKVKFLNRGQVSPFHKSPVKITVKLDTEPSKNKTEKVLGQFSVNGRHIYNALVILEDGRGNHVTAGTTNSFGFYQIPVLPGNYTLKIYTPQWDMFYTENVSVYNNLNTIAHLNIIGYSPRIVRKNYNSLPAKQRSAQPISNGRRPNYNNAVKGKCTANCGEIRGLIKDAQTGKEIPFAAVMLQGTNIGLTTDLEGSYSIKNLAAGTYTLVIKYVGYESQSIRNIKVKAGSIIYANIELRENKITTGNLVIYDRVRPSIVKGDELGRYEMDEGVYLTESNFYTQAAPAKANYSIKSLSNVNATEQIMIAGKRTSGKYYIDGVRVVGNDELKEKKLVKREEEDQRLQQMLGNADAMRVRKNFRDYAYWIPNMLTNRKGKAGFSVRIPDNQTQWITYVPAMDYKRKTGLGVAYMRAYKPITANLSLPRFMVAGDKLQIFGKAVNYTSDSVVLNTTLKINNKTIFNRPMGVRYFDTAVYTYQPKKAGLNNLLYQVTLPNGYIDGDLRPLRVIENGLLVSDGETRTLKGDVNFTLLPKQGYKHRQVLLSNRKAELVMAEIQQLKNYQYGCVEQTASKLKALLLEKEISKSLNRTFTDDKYIKTCIKTLQKKQHRSGGWGWWDKSNVNYWMTMYATDALYKAQKAGYKTAAALAGANYINRRYSNLSIQDQLKAVNLFLTMRYKPVSREVVQLNKYNLNLQNRLLLLRAKQMQGQKINIDTIVKMVRYIGNDKAAWGEKLFSIYVNEISTSAIAYEILKADGDKHKELLKKVRNYFLSQAPSERNTIQSATFLETFLRDIVDEDTKRKELLPQLKLNGKEDKRHSIKLNLSDNDTLNISKTGSELFYLYSWKNFVGNPTANSSTFKINTHFKQGKHKGDTLQVGKAVTLYVDVSLSKSRDYVMVEIPIPAGFSYESKAQSRRFGEVHREYFKDKVSIFFTQLNKGHYYFTIQLLPKFKGKATLLPTRAEEMYFPINSGNNTKRTITIK